MPTRKAETYELGAVDSRSNPANFPMNRSLRCLNWAPQSSGGLRLRSGYSLAMQASNDTLGATAIHSMIYYEQFAATQLGPQYCLYGKGANLLQFNMATGVSELISAMPSANPWGHFRSGNRVHIGDGTPQFVQWTGYVGGEGWTVGFFNWDGATMRPSGLPDAGLAPLAPASAFGEYATVLASTLGSFTPTTLGGYAFYIALYNPVTQHMGNARQFSGNYYGRFASATARQNVTNTASIIVLSGNIFGGGTGTPGFPFSDELVWAIGMTNDGGEVPYWMIDANGNHIVLGNTQRVATLELGAVDYLSELPARNDMPPAFDKFARVGTRIFANLSGDPYIYYSNDISDVTNANYVGNPEESWPADQAEPFPTGELPTCIQGGQYEGWFFSRSSLAIWSSILQAQGANPWRGPWPGGCAGQRAFVDTPYGRYWLSNEKQLCTFMDDGVISVSEEYELALLGKLASATLSSAELAYQLDTENLVDQIAIKGSDANGNPVFVVHDFRLKDERSPFGCGYNYVYSNLVCQTFMGAGYTPRTNAYDTTGKMRLWAGSKSGFIAQLEDGSVDDNGATYSADHIGIINMGLNRPGLDEIEYQGDPALQVSWLDDYSQSDVAAFDLVAGEVIQSDSGYANPSRFGVKLVGEARWLYTRLQLTSHGADGNFELTDPPFLPMPSYGAVNAIVLKLGRERPEARG
jgi:hypothetical protein